MSEVVQSLFGINPTDILAQREAMAQRQAMQFAQMEPMQQAMYGANLAGNRIGGAVGGLLGAQDPELQQVAQRQSLASQIDWSNPDSIKKAAQLAAKNGDTRAAMELIKRADDVTSQVLERGVKQSQIVKNLREKQSLSVEEQIFKTLAAKASPQSVKAAMDNGNDITMLDVDKGEKISTYGRMLLEAGYKQDSPEFKAQMSKYVEAELQGASKRGSTTIHMPGQGTAKVSDINPTISQIRQELEPSKSAYTDVTSALALLDQNNPKGDAQVDRLLGTMAGDKQLSMAEVQSVSSAGSFPQRVVDSFSKFFTGQAGQLSKDQKKEVLELYQDILANRHNSTQQRLKSVYSTSELSQDQVKALIGDPLGARKKQTAPSAVGQQKTSKGTSYRIVE